MCVTHIWRFPLCPVDTCGVVELLFYGVFFRVRSREVNWGSAKVREYGQHDRGRRPGRASAIKVESSFPVNTRVSRLCGRRSCRTSTSVRGWALSWRPTWTHTLTCMKTFTCPLLTDMGFLTYRHGILSTFKHRVLKTLEASTRPWLDETETDTLLVECQSGRESILLQ